MATIIESLLGALEDKWIIDIDDLEFGEEIGDGSFGKVYRGDLFGTPVAIKLLFNVDSEETQKYIYREVMMLKDIAHPLVVQFMGICTHDGDIFIVTEWVPGGDLRNVMNDDELSGGQHIPWKRRIEVCKDVCIAMNYLHKRKFVHRDVKPENMLIAESGRIKICDLGFTRKEDSGYMTIAGSDDYMAPEVILGQKYDQSCDVFGFGVCLFEIIACREPPERGPSTYFGFTNEMIAPYIPAHVPPMFANLMFGCCEFDAAKRPTFAECLLILKELLRDLPPEAALPPVPRPVESNGAVSSDSVPRDATAAVPDKDNSAETEEEEAAAGPDRGSLAAKSEEEEPTAGPETGKSAAGPGKGSPVAEPEGEVPAARPDEGEAHSLPAPAALGAGGGVPSVGRPSGVAVENVALEEQPDDGEKGQVEPSSEGNDEIERLASKAKAKAAAPAPPPVHHEVAEATQASGDESLGDALVEASQTGKRHARKKKKPGNKKPSNEKAEKGAKSPWEKGGNDGKKSQRGMVETEAQISPRAAAEKEAKAKRLPRFKRIRSTASKRAASSRDHMVVPEGAEGAHGDVSMSSSSRHPAIPTLSIHENRGANKSKFGPKTARARLGGRDKRAARKAEEERRVLQERLEEAQRELRDLEERERRRKERRREKRKARRAKDAAGRGNDGEAVKLAKGQDNGGGGATRQGPYQEQDQERPPQASGDGQARSERRGVARSERRGVDPELEIRLNKQESG